MKHLIARVLYFVGSNVEELGQWLMYRANVLWGGR